MISKSIFITNFPNSTTSFDLWNLCQVYGTVVDVYIPNRRSKAGKRFAFVRFIKVDNVDRLVGNLCTLWIGRMHLHANVVRFERSPLQSSWASQPIRPDKIAPSFASAVKGFSVAPLSALPTMIGSKWGEVLELEECRDDFFARKRICIKTKQEDNILEKFKIIVKGKIFVVRAKELFVWSLTFKDVPEMVYCSDDDSTKEMGVNQTEFSKQTNLEDESDSKTVSDTYFGDNSDELGNVADSIQPPIENEISNDPFNIYDLLNKCDKEVDNTVKDIYKEAEQDMHADQVRSNSKSEGCNLRILEDSQKIDEHFSSKVRGSGFKHSEGSSILEILYEMIKVGQTMGFSIDGCLESKAKKEWIRELNIKYKVNFLTLQETKMDSISAMEVKFLWGNSNFEHLFSEALGNSGGILCTSDPNVFHKEHHIISDNFVALRMEERWGSVFNVYRARAFNNFITNSGLVTVQLEGYTFTWAHPSATKMSKLDRFLVTDGLLSLFPHVSAVCLDRHLSNHRPILLREAIEGDENSKFFHGIINRKRANLAVKGIMIDGEWVDDPSHVKDEFRTHFAARFQDPGICHGCNSSFIALIPKSLDPKSMSNYRPISLIGSLYKVVTKILATRLSMIFSDLISDIQTAFLPNPQILDGPFIIMSSSLNVITKSSGLCLHSGLASILVNGSPTSKLQFHCGLKQGDPLAPYLFILIMESLHLSFSRVIDAGIFTGVRIDSSRMISHLFYADDVVFIGEWSHDNLKGTSLMVFMMMKGRLLRLNGPRQELSASHSSTWSFILKEINTLKAQGVELISHCKIRVGNVADKMNAHLTSSFRRTVRGGTESLQLAHLLDLLGPVILSNIEDRWIWDMNGDGVFHVKDVRILLDEVSLDRLPTRSNLSRRGVVVPSLSCPICNLIHEDTGHLLFSSACVSHHSSTSSRIEYPRDGGSEAAEQLLQREQWASLSTHPSKHLHSFCFDDDDEDYTSAVTPDEPVLSTEEPDNSPNQFEDFSESNEEFSSIDDDSFSVDKIDYVEASPPDSELVNSEVIEIIIPEETNTFDNSLPEFKTFCFDVDISLPEYEAFHDDHVKEISSGSLTTHYDSSLYASFIFDLSINPFPPVDRSDFYEFTDELIPFISAPEYDFSLFKVEPN
nr:RNA-directed DNA polymerase, eukaryota [Tanacetum cinerariifolium]